jgi:antitoxin ParD1/3/4
MAKFAIDIPPALEAWANSQVENGVFEDVSDYVRHLIRRDQEKAQPASRFIAPQNTSLSRA